MGRMIGAIMLLALVVCTGCTEAQKGAMLGTLLGGFAGSMSSKKNRNRNALIGVAIGAIGGGMYGKNKEANRLRGENAITSRELENYRIRREIEQLQQENPIPNDANGSREQRTSGALARGVF